MLEDENSIKLLVYDSFDGTGVDTILNFFKKSEEFLDDLDNYIKNNKVEDEDNDELLVKEIKGKIIEVLS